MARGWIAHLYFCLRISTKKLNTRMKMRKHNAYQFQLTYIEYVGKWIIKSRSTNKLYPILD